MCLLEHSATTPSASSSKTAVPGDIADLEVSFGVTATDLSCFRADLASFRPVPRGGQFTVIRKIAKGIHGDVFRYRWARLGHKAEEVAVKRLERTSLEQLRGTQTDERKVHLNLGGQRAPCAEDALTEIGVLQHLSQQADLPLYLLKMRSAFADRGSIWLVTELADGGELFADVARRGRLPEEECKHYTWQVLQALSYLHRHGIGHRDLSLENILLKAGDVRLMDFGMAVRSRSADGVPLRYFRAVGKDKYRAPECYVPALASIQVVAPARSSPHGIALASYRDACSCEVRLPASAEPGQPCAAEPCGYLAPPADIFAVGVCILVMMRAPFRWERALLHDALFAAVHAGGWSAALEAWGADAPAAPGAAELLGDMLRSAPGARPSADDSLGSAWFADMHSAAVPVHPLEPPACDAMPASALAGA